MSGPAPAARLLRLALALAASVALAAAWTWRTESPRRDARVIKFAYVGSVDDPRHRSALELERRLEAASGGRFDVQLYYGGQLGGDRDAIEGVRLGTVEMTVAGAGVFATFEPRMGVTALPYLFDDLEQAWSFVDGDVHAGVTARLLRKGVRVLAHWENGFRSITTADRAIASPRDLAGLKIRTPENPIILSTMRVLGADPNPLPWPEVYMALQQEAFDGQENPVPIIHAGKLYEVQKHLSLTRHVYEPMPLVVSEIFWRQLDDAERAVLAGAARESQAFNRRLVAEQNEALLRDLRAKGMTVTVPDLAPFRDATRDVRRAFVGSIGAELIDAAYAHAALRRTPGPSAPAASAASAAGAAP